MSPSLPPPASESRTEVLDKLQRGINGLADGVKLSARQHRLGVWINVVAACLTACIGLSVLVVVSEAVEQLTNWYHRLELWDDRLRAETEQRNKQMAANASLSAGLQKMLEAQTAKTLNEQERALEQAEKYALAAEVKSTQVQLEIAREEKAPPKTEERLSTRYQKAKKKAFERGVSLDEF